MTPLAPCARCGRVPEMGADACGYEYMISCRACYDGAPDSSRRTELGHGPTRDAAAKDWYWKMDELAGDIDAGLKSTPLAYCLTLTGGAK